MAGEEGLLNRCTAESVEVTAVTGEGGMMEGCSTKRKAPEEVVRGGQLMAPMKESTTKRKAEEVTGCPAVATAVAEAEDSAGEKPPERKNRMSKREIRWILAQKPMSPPTRYQALKRSNPDLTPRPDEEMDEDKESLYYLAKAFYCMEERFPKLQEWVREELETKGYVEMDDDWVKRRAEDQAIIDEGWKKIEALLPSILLDDDDDDESDYDDDDEEEEEEGQEQEDKEEE